MMKILEAIGAVILLFISVIVEGIKTLIAIIFG